MIISISPKISIEKNEFKQECTTAVVVVIVVTKTATAAAVVVVVVVIVVVVVVVTAAAAGGGGIKVAAQAVAHTDLFRQYNHYPKRLSDEHDVLLIA